MTLWTIAGSSSLSGLFGGRFARRISLFSVAGMLLLPACTQSPPATPRSSTSPATGPIALPTQAPGGAPTTTTTATDEQLAIKAIERFYDELNKAVVSLSTKEFRTTYKPGCEPCDQAANKIDSTAAAGRRFEGGRVTVGGIKVVDSATTIQMFMLEALSLASVMGPPRCHEHGTTWGCQ